MLVRAWGFRRLKRAYLMNWFALVFLPLTQSSPEHRAVARSGIPRLLVGVQRATALCRSARCPRFILLSRRRRRQKMEFATALGLNNLTIDVSACVKLQYIYGMLEVTQASLPIPKLSIGARRDL